MPEIVDRPTGGKMCLVRELLRPYQGWLIIILLAMLIETAMSLAAPWPLKVIIDNVIGRHKPPEWLTPFRALLGESKMELAALAGIATVLIATLGEKRRSGNGKAPGHMNNKLQFELSRTSTEAQCRVS